MIVTDIFNEYGRQVYGNDCDGQVQTIRLSDDCDQHQVQAMIVTDIRYKPPDQLTDIFRQGLVEGDKQVGDDDEQDNDNDDDADYDDDDGNDDYDEFSDLFKSC